MGHNNKKTIITTSLVAGLGLAAIPALAIALGASSSASATGVSGTVRLNAEVATAIAMKIASPNDTNPDCMEQSGVTYGVANRYATSNGAEGSKQVDTFDGTPGGADEVNSNTSCATLTMNPNAFSSTYSDITIYTNSPNGYSLTVRSADNTSPNLVNTTDPTQYIPAAALTEADGTVDDGQGGTTTAKVVPGGQNKWALKSDTGLLDTWTPVATTDTTVRSYDQETDHGSTTRVTYGISAGNNVTGKYATTLSYTATMFDGDNPSVPSIIPATVSGLSFDTNKLKIPYGATRTITITPAAGHYLASLTCSNGFTCVDENGDPIETGTSATASQIVYVTNNSVKTGSGTIEATAGTSEYTVSASATNATVSTASLSIPYGGSATLTVTPTTGYYLSSYSCPEGYTCTKSDDTAISTGDNAEAQAAQTIKVTNNNTVSGGSLTFTGALRNLTVAITPSIAASTDTNSLSVPYGGSKTFTITPNAGYYLTGITCSTGYTCSTPTYGSAADPNATSRGAQTITVTNNSTTNTGAVSFTLDNKYRISFSKTNISSPSEDYIDIAYGGQTTVTVTPATDRYYLYAVSCPTGYTCSGYNTGSSYTSQQTMTIKNDNTASTGTLTLTGKSDDDWVNAGCDNSTKDSPCTVNGKEYVKTADGHYWSVYTVSSTVSNGGSASNDVCPSGTTVAGYYDMLDLGAAYGGFRNGYEMTGISGVPVGSFDSANSTTSDFTDNSTSSYEHTITTFYYGSFGGSTINGKAKNSRTVYKYNYNTGSTSGSSEGKITLSLRCLHR